MVRRISTSTMILPMASGFLRRRLIPSLKNVVDSPMTSCCFFSSSVAFSKFALLNLLRSTCADRICLCFNSITSIRPFVLYSNVILGSTNLYAISVSRFATTIRIARKIVVAIIIV